ncbi:hypothetical protein NC651_028147 [Populus alba x Populus x berolinensis]|nr:hypothetical protein NC651_028147 [Populus alba x Populus x berolinensis]
MNTAVFYTMYTSKYMILADISPSLLSSRCRSTLMTFFVHCHAKTEVIGVSLNFLENAENSFTPQTL